eukprot:TRINITY_DN6226_c0_g1_i1.p1 TRINITY_DN6226_c0_g1~~TRINITY_DN6226_c0_g1_i1.p1  ORF type:complete len:337 (+),score=82.89 TRINITY_DN6226_c0_g1_i1:95-1105(+)
MAPPAQKEEVRFVTFNQDASCLAVGTTKGFRIFTVDPFLQCYAKMCGGMNIVSMLYRTSLLAIVGAGSSQQSPRQLQLHNTHEQQSICNISFADTILAVKLNRKRLVVILEKCLHIFDVTKMAPLQIIDTVRNPRGLGALSMCRDGDDACVVAYPKSVEQGGESHGDVVIVDAITGKSAHVIRAHDSTLAAIALSASGSRVATASEKGTIIRVFGITPETTPLLHIFRRGRAAARIYSLAFNERASLLACHSSTGTVHVFASTADGAPPPREGGARSEERSVTKLTVKDPSEQDAVCISRDSQRLMVATSTGRLFTYLLDVGQSECKLEREHLVVS